MFIRDSLYNIRYWGGPRWVIGLSPENPPQRTKYRLSCRPNIADDKFRFSYPEINQLTDTKYVYIEERKQLVSHWNRFIPLRNSKYTNVVGVVLLIYFLRIRTDFCCDFLIKRFGGRNYSVPTYAPVYKTFVNYRPSLL